MDDQPGVVFRMLVQKLQSQPGGCAAIQIEIIPNGDLAAEIGHRAGGGHSGEKVGAFIPVDKFRLTGAAVRDAHIELPGGIQKGFAVKGQNMLKIPEDEVKANQIVLMAQGLGAHISGVKTVGQNNIPTAPGCFAA